MKLLFPLLFVFCTAAVARDQVAVAVWKGKNCVELLETVRAYAPMVNGKPDLKNVHLTGVQLDPKCLTYEIRK